MAYLGETFIPAKGKHAGHVVTVIDTRLIANDMNIVFVRCICGERWRFLERDYLRVFADEGPP